MSEQTLHTHMRLPIKEQSDHSLYCLFAIQQSFLFKCWPFKESTFNKKTELLFGIVYPFTFMQIVSQLHRGWSIFTLTLLHSERPNLHTILAFLSAIGLTNLSCLEKKKKLCSHENPF